MRAREEEVPKKGREEEDKGDESGGDHPSHLSPSTERLIRDAISNDAGVPTTRPQEAAVAQAPSDVLVFVTCIHSSLE
ncbi:hypothetical protein GW17_00029521 [Ensete ventricosum]|nr:hypothetical protein GW17_00029521 [Ensete ventricosum]